MTSSHGFRHPIVSRRTAISAGAIGLLGLGSNHVTGLQALAAESASLLPGARAKSVIYIFLSGGLAQHESFDLKPDAPAETASCTHSQSTRADNTRTIVVGLRAFRSAAMLSGAASVSNNSTMASRG